jgi:acyl-homoserine lactone acylase PvdQ
MLGAAGLGTRGVWMRRARRTVTAVFGALAALIAFSLLSLASTAGAAPPPLVDLSGPAFQILAPGAEGGLTAGPYSTDQGKLYDKLTPKIHNVSAKALEKDFVSEKFGVTGPILRTESTGRPGLEIVRDNHDIPHVFGETRADVMFGSGWIAAEDRGLLLRLGLGPAYTAAVDVPGVNAFQLLLSQRSFTPSTQSKEFVAAQTSTLLEKGPKGEQVLHDLENWVEGVNAFQQTLPPAARLPTVTVTDAIAGFAFIGSIFGNGGGGEVANSDLLSGLQSKYGAEEGLKIFRDLRETNDPEAPTTTSKPFPYDGVPTGPTPGAAVIDHNSVGASAARAQAEAAASHRDASNFLVVGANDTKSGHPVAVMGPQLGYFYPEIVMQADLHGGGIDASGIVAPISPYVFIGRGRDFAWSLTSADSENTQQFLEKLCNPDNSPPTRESDHYEYNGQCIAMTTFDAGLLGAHGSEPARELVFKETVHGPVTGTVTVGGQPYAVAKDRSTRGHEPEGELAFSDLDSNVVHSPEQFFEAANELGTTFNMAYLDSKNIAYFSTGRLPVLAEGTDPSLPTFGTGQYDWKGFLTLAQHPHEVAPANDQFLSWNNKPAPEWGAASDTYSWGPVHRVQLFTGFDNKMTEAKDATVMNTAATQDLRAIKVWPVVEQVLAGGPAPSKLAEEAAGLVSKWIAKGAHRAGNKDAPKDPGAAVIDSVWTPIAEDVLGPVLGELLPEFKSMNSPDDPPNPQGSSFDNGWYGYVYKDLRAELGESEQGAFSREYCGNGSLEACRESLWASIQTAAEQLQASQGPNPSAWRAAAVRIEFPPGLLPFTMRWTNRSTFQQVIEFTGHEEGGGPCKKIKAHC